MGGVIPANMPAPALLLAAGLVLGACTTAPEDPDNTAPQSLAATPEPTTYVALGDSYAALGSVDASTTGPEICQRSADNYPALLLQDPGLEGRDVTCSGAVTADILAPLETAPEIAPVPAQADALHEGVGAVTLSIGGNDIGFGGIVNCFITAIRTNQPSGCAPALQETTAAQLAELPARLDLVHGEIAERAPRATVLVTGYIPLVAPGDDCVEIAALSEADRRWIVELTEQLNGTVAAAAERHGAAMVLPEEVSGHSGCAALPERWVDFFGLETGAYPMHPTAVGQEAMAAAVREEL